MHSSPPYDYVMHYQKVVEQLRAEAAKPNAAKAACERAADYIESRLSDPIVVQNFSAFAANHTDAQQKGEAIKAANYMQFSAEPCAEGLTIRVQLNGAVSATDAQQFFDLADGIYNVLFPGQLIDRRTNVREVPRVHTFTATKEAAALFEGWQINKQKERG